MSTSHQKHQDDDADEPCRVQIGSITVTVKKGTIAQEKVDVIVNSTSPDLNLKSGRASKALLEAAGQSIQDECKSKYPKGVQHGKVAETSGGDLDCQHLFHGCLKCADSSDSQSEEVLREFITTCLFKLDKHLMSSISFPALGTGFIGIPADQAAVIFFQCISLFEKNNRSTTLTDVRIVIYPRDEDTFQTFVYIARQAENGSIDEIGEGHCSSKPGCKGTLQDNGLTTSSSPRSGHVTPSIPEDECFKIKIGKVVIQLIQGSLIDQRADIFVINTNGHMNLDNGSLSKAIGRAAGPELQQECSNKYPDGIEPGQIAITNGYKLPCKSVYFCTIPQCTDEKDLHAAADMIYQTVQMCFIEANSQECQSIVFPALGTGYQNFPPEVSAWTVLKAIAEYCVRSKHPIVKDVKIVIYTQTGSWKHIWEAFHKYLKKLSKEVLKADLENLLLTLAKVFQTKMVKIDHDQTSESSETKAAAPVQQGSKEWFLKKYGEELCAPKYWTKFQGDSLKNLKFSHSQTGSNCNYYLVDVDKSTEEAVKKLVYASWEMDKVGYGRDAGGLDCLPFSKIKVIKVQRVENLDLFEKYSIERQQLFSKAAKKGKGFTQLQDLQKSNGPVKTMVNISPLLKSDIYPEINEFYLFHGTKAGKIEAILSQGLDNRMAGDYAMLGHGVYAAESSTKADQYVDTRSKRSVGEEKQMLLIRMCMGEICVCDKAKKYRRSPCLSCFQDDCSTHQQFSDSLVCDGLWIFREFVVYDPRQSYPEYLITYVRG